MKKTTKLLAVIASSVLLAGNVMAMTSCGGDENSIKNTEIVTGNVNSVAYDGSKVTVTFYHTMGDALETILVRNIKRFNEQYPNIEVKQASQGDYPGVRDKITTEMQGNNTAPSIAYCYPDHVALYNKSKAALPLDDFINHPEVGLSQEQINDFVPAYYDEGKVYGDNKMYTLPMLKSTEVLYYNKTYFEANAAMFAEKGLDVETTTTPESVFDGMTWDQMETICEVITESEKALGNRCIPLGYDSEANWFITMCEQYGSPYTDATMNNDKNSHFLFNNETNRGFVETFREWYKKGYVTTEALNGGTYTSNLFKETDGKKLHTFMSIGSSAGASYQCPSKNSDGVTYPFEVGVTMIPQVDVENPKMISQGPSLCMFKKGSEQEMAAAWLFVKFLSTDIQLQASLSMNNGYSSAVQSVANNEIYADFLSNADGNAYLQATCINQTIAMRDYYYVSPAFFGSSTARDDVGTLIQTCFSKDPAAGQTVSQFIEKSFEDAVKTLAKRYDK
ncbi:MAG: extracellular solute-binding protein [Clostridia bacterium]|nr:extracellular solute-binding protein [Clostridia bacterium]